MQAAAVFCACALPGQEEAASRPTVVDAGALRLEIHIARTPQIFHVVDQLSAWDEFCHLQYVRAMEGGFAGRDVELLGEHKTLRKTRPWGAGLEQTFYTQLGFDQALRAGVEHGHLTQEQADTERRVLEHFAERIDKLYADELPVLSAFRDRLVAEREQLRGFATKISRFCGGARVTVPVFLIANPDERDFGGGFNGERLTLEIPKSYDAMPSFLHETMHAFVATKEDRLRAVLAKEPTLDYQTLNEGIAYALAPGIYHAVSETDPLAGSVRQDLAAKSGFEASLVRFRRYALALRPALRESLDEAPGSIDTFLPRAIDAWRTLLEFERARPDKACQWFSAGPAWQELQNLFNARREPISSFNHSAEHYRQTLWRAGLSSRLVLTRVFRKLCG